MTNTPVEMDGRTFVRMIHAGAENLEANAEIVNELNVFPIPDGDTGTNMSMTIGGGLHSVDAYEGTSIGKAAEILADGMVLSARGNSGVILSQLFAGMATGLQGKTTATVSDLAGALQSGVKNAYAAVIHPTEGTILTVAREAADFASSRINKDSTILSFGKDYLQELGASLRRTPEMLDVLKEAGVIDSGGAGLYYIVDGIVKNGAGQSVTAEPARKISVQQVQKPDISRFNENSVMEFGYCTEFLLQLQTAKTDVQHFDIQKLTDYLQTMGNSIVAFQNGTVIKVHVHTMFPGKVMTHCQEYGEFLTVKVENMTLQHHETTIRNRFVFQDEEKQKMPEGFTFQPEKKKERKKYGLVTVASGEGIRKTFSDLGADVIIEGGQGHNPSTEDFTEAFREANADTIFVLPNNGNTILAARQAAELTEDAEVYIVESRNIGEGYAALTMLDYDSDDPEQILAGLLDAIRGVKTGMVSRAIRDAVLNGIDVKKGNYIGFTDKTVMSTAADKQRAVLDMLSAMQAQENDVLILICGTSVSQAEKESVLQEVHGAFPRLETYDIDGGLDLYDYTAVLE